MKYNFLIDWKEEFFIENIEAENEKQALEKAVKMYNDEKYFGTGKVELNFKVVNDNYRQHY